LPPRMRMRARSYRRRSNTEIGARRAAYSSSEPPCGVSQSEKLRARVALLPKTNRAIQSRLICCPGGAKRLQSRPWF
jgi:hypothetical protein